MRTPKGVRSVIASSALLFLCAGYLYYIGSFTPKRTSTLADSEQASMRSSLEICHAGTTNDPEVA